MVTGAQLLLQPCLQLIQSRTSPFPASPVVSLVAADGGEGAGAVAVGRGAADSSEPYDTLTGARVASGMSVLLRYLSKRLPNVIANVHLRVNMGDQRSARVGKC